MASLSSLAGDLCPDLSSSTSDHAQLDLSLSLRSSARLDFALSALHLVNLGPPLLAKSLSRLGSPTSMLGAQGGALSAMERAHLELSTSSRGRGQLDLMLMVLSFVNLGALRGSLWDVRPKAFPSRLGHCCNWALLC